MDSFDPILIVAVVVLALLYFINFIFSVLVCIKMFQNGQSGMGIACLVMSFLCLGLGIPVSFIFGWLKAGEWKIKGIMIGWTGFGVVSFLVFACMGAIIPMLGTKASATFTTVGQTIGI